MVSQNLSANKDETNLNTSETLVLLSKNAFEAKEYKNVLHLFKIAFSLYEFCCPLEIFRYARSSYRNLKENHDNQKMPSNDFSEYWKSFTLPHMKSCSELMNLFLNPSKNKINVNELNEKFRNVIDSSNLTEIHKQFYINSFEIFTKAFDKKLTGNQKLYVPYNHRTNKIIVAGIGYSGSSAVYDYLREFEQVFLLDREKPILENKSIGFLGLINKFENRQLNLKDIILFYFINIICCIEIFDSSYYKQIRFNLREIRVTKNKNAYFELLLSCSVILCNLAIEIQSKHPSDCKIFSLLKQLGNSIVDMSFVDLPENFTPISRSLFHINNIKILNYIDNITFIPVLRDPRSRFVAYKYDNYNDIKVDRYIDESETCYQNYTSELLNISHNNTSKNIIHPVHFEDFVIYEKYRIDVLNTIGINVTQHVNQGKFFIRDASLKNVYSFKDYKNQEDIKKIESRLGKYCYKF